MKKPKALHLIFEDLADAIDARAADQTCWPDSTDADRAQINAVRESLTFTAQAVRKVSQTHGDAMKDESFPSLDESDRVFRDALAYGLFVTDPTVVLLATVDYLRYCVRHRDANSSEIPKRVYEKLWEDARVPSSPAYYKRLEAIGRAMAVHREMIAKMEKMP